MPRDRRKAKTVNHYGEELNEEMLFKRYLRYKDRLKNDDFRAFRNFVCECVAGSESIRLYEGKIKKKNFKKLVSRFNEFGEGLGRKRPKYAENDSSNSNSGSSNNTDDDQACDVCEKPGELLICDSCDRAFHLRCVGLKKVPSAEQWFCSHCTQDQQNSSENVSVEATTPTPRRSISVSSKALCIHCRKPDDVALYRCSKCSSFYHLLCFVPPIDDNLLLSNNKSKDNIVCQLCYNHAALDDLKVDAIVACRTFQVSPSREVVNKYSLINKPYEVNFYLVKILDLSFWHCFWVDEFNLKKEHPSRLRYFVKKMHEQGRVSNVDYVDIQKLLSSSNNFNSRRKKEVSYTDEIYHSCEQVDFVISSNHLNVDICKNDLLIDENFLKTYFCKYHIKYDWFFIDRILSTEDNQFLIKWRDQNYMSTSWEFDNHPCIKFQVEEFTQAVLVYLSINMKQPHVNLLADKKKAATAVTIDYSPRTNKNNELSNFKLHQYQVDGVNWLLSSYNDGTNTILADEMGLGKTIQSATFLYKLFNENICRGPFLIVGPLSTINNWEIEFSKWAPKMYVVKFIGSGVERDLISLHDFDTEPIKYNFENFKNLLYKNVSCADKLNSLVVTDSSQAVKVLNSYFNNNNNNLSVKRTSRFHVLLTNYEAITNLTGYFKKTHYRVVLVDEAHRLKNMNSLFFSTMCQLDIGYKCLLTGTPLQNSLEELYNLLYYIDPEDEYIQSKERFLSHFESIDKDEQIVFLKKILGSRMLRRNKEDVLQRLPPKQEIIVPVNLTAKQIEYYKALLTKNYKVITSNSATSGTLLNIMVQLRKICNHTCIFGDLSQADDLNTLLSGSGKMEFMHRLLKRLYAKQHRVLIFSQMTRMLDLIELFLVHMNYAYERLDGMTKAELRQAAIDRFNRIDSTSFIFLLSTKAGGLGINLASADTVIIYDSDWNPQNDMQALSRAHRLGQNKPVLVFRLVARYTVEEKVIENARSKLLMTNIVVRSAKLVNNYTNRGKSLDSMDYFSLNEILKHGTDQLFEKITTNKLEYTDADIERMLDRTNLKNDDGENTEGGNMVMDELLGNFKMAKYSLPTEEIPQEETETTNNDIGNAHEYWEKLLKVEYEKLTLEEQQKYQEEIDNLGKGKRARNNINYSDFTEKSHKKKVPVTNDEEEYIVENEEWSDEFEDSLSVKSPTQVVPENHPQPFSNIKNLHTSQFELNNTQKKTLLPPLKTSKPTTLPKTDSININNNINNNNVISLSKAAGTEVAASLYRYGYPPANYDSLVQNWCRHDELKRYSLNEIMRYIGSLLKDVFTLRVDNESVASNDDKEAMIMRIATMELVRDKVYQYGYLNDDTLPIMYKYMVFGPAAMDERAVKDRVLNARNLRKSILDRMPPTNNTMERVCKAYFFNIEDGGYSLLHQHWQMERESSRLSQIWWRRHDLWLLLAVLVHGHSQYQAILKNPDFEVISRVLRSVFSDASMLSFMRNRFNLLEQALYCERIYVMSQLQDKSTEVRPIDPKKAGGKVTNLLGWHVQAFQLSEQFMRDADKLFNKTENRNELKARVQSMQEQLKWLKELLALGEASLTTMAEEHSAGKCRNFMRLFKLTNYPLNFMTNWKNV